MSDNGAPGEADPTDRDGRGDATDRDEGGDPTDRDDVLARYLAERDKRLRADGNDQYLEVTGRLAHYVEDPYVERAERDPIDREVNVAVVGGGFAGLVTGARLREAGVDDVCLIEKGGDVGGTWYWNRYPGAQCDTAAMVYLPLLEETGHMPSEKYTHGPEILEHSRRIARQYGLYDDALLSTEVTDVRWDEPSSRWLVSTDRGDTIRARFITLGTGPLHRPKLPGIDGIEDFTGHSFHTSRWDYDYTGGTPDGGLMTGLADKKVGIIGTGATAVQCIPHLAEACGELYVFQRTPSSIDIRNNHPIDPEWFDTLEPGWQRRWLENFTILQTGGIADEDLVKDGWTDLAKRIRDRALADPNQDFSPESLLRAYHESDDEKMVEIRARVDELIGDAETAAALKPWYRQLCKRPCFHDAYLQSYNRPNVELVDTDGQGVRRITGTGVEVDGRHIELDCIVYASGFEVGTDWARRSGFDPLGRDGETLNERWDDGMVSLHGMHVRGFPNAFVVGFSQAANLISNVPHNLVEAATTVTAIVTHALATGAEQVETTAEAESAWVARLEAGGRRFGNDPTCTPGYYNNEGQDPGRKGLLNSLGFPEGPVAFFAFIDDWRTNGRFDGLEFRTAGRPVEPETAAAS
ncbi:MAG: NAD(P)/FAD-dependent oxidoreductase [Actinomycetota bacterium]